MSAVASPGHASKASSQEFRQFNRYRPSDVTQVATLWRVLIVAIAIASNAALLICQQVAIRLLAPLIGSSIETWSAILGVFLLGIAAGNFIAGKLADRCSATKMIAASLVLGSLSVLLMQVVVWGLTASDYFAALPLELQTISASVAVCFLPGLTLSLVTPPSIRSVVHRAADAGNASGRIFAWGTFGSLLGNYLTGFVLIAMFGIAAIVQVTWIVLLALAVLVLLIGRQVAGQLTVPVTVPLTMPRAPSLIADDPQFGANSVGSKDPTFESTLEFAANQWYVRAIVIVTTCSFVSGALEGAAFRILAPLVGVSMFLSAGVVGVVLTGMAIGNALGGLMAARYGTVAALKKSLAVAAFSTLAIVIIWTLALRVGFYDGWPMIPKVVVWSFSLFLVPALALGTVTPQVIGLSVRDVSRTGSITGQLYGFSTLGCILGIMVSAWCLIENLGAIRTSIVCGILPLLMILLLSRFEAMPLRRESWRMALGLIVFGGFLFFHHQSPFDRESKYFALKVTDATVEDRELKKLALDSLIHSCIDLKDPSFLFYPHEQIQADLTRAAAAEARAAGRTPRVLVIGGGGYSYPRWVEAQADLADVQIDVVEIDPAVTEIAHDKLGLSRSTRIVSIHKDGRQYVKNAPAATYDLVIQDAVNDMSVPYHLMTAEYEGLVKRLLHPNCLYLLTVIDNVDSGRFLASAVRTTNNVFGNVNLMLPAKPEADTRYVFVIAGRNLPGDNSATANTSSSTGAEPGSFFTNVERQAVRESTFVFPQTDVARLLHRSPSLSPILTDDFAPVDVLMSGQFLRRENPEL